MRRAEREEDPPARAVLPYLGGRNDRRDSTDKRPELGAAPVGARDHRGSRRISQTCGPPPGTSISSTTSKPCRR
jgi:hypothetical protein